MLYYRLIIKRVKSERQFPSDWEAILDNWETKCPVAAPLTMPGMPLHTLVHKWICHRCKIPMLAYPRFVIEDKISSTYPVTDKGVLQKGSLVRYHCKIPVLAYSRSLICDRKSKKR